MEEKLCTPQKVFKIPILEILIENGGELPKIEVLTKLEKKLTLLPGDKTLMDAGEIKWQNTAAWAVSSMRKNGEEDSTIRGIWKITEKGRQKYQREKNLYDPNDFKPYPLGKRRRRKSKQQRIYNLPHPTEVTTDFLQDWGYKRGLNLLDLGLEGVREKYKEFYYQNVQVSDEEYLNIIYGIFRDIKAYIEGKPTVSPTSEQVCQWINLCYLFKHYWEGTKLFNMLDSDSVSEDFYRIAKKIAETCKNKC